jgi:hypothetical protein
VDFMLTAENDFDNLPASFASPPSHRVFQFLLKDLSS